MRTFGDLFADTIMVSEPHAARAMWNAIPYDRPKRSMMAAAVKVLPDAILDLHPKAQDDILWMLDNIQKLEDHRNNAIHAPIYNYDDPFWQILVRPVAAFTIGNLRRAVTREGSSDRLPLLPRHGDSDEGFCLRYRRVLDDPFAFSMAR